MACATQNEGIADICRAIASFRRRSGSDAALVARARSQASRHLESLIKTSTADCLWKHIRHTPEFQKALYSVQHLQIDPYSATREVVHRLVERILADSE